MVALSAIEAARAANMLGVSKNSFATILPAWLIDPRAGRGQRIAPVIKCEFDGGILMDPQFGLKSASGRICAFKIDEQTNITFRQVYEPNISYETWTQYCLAYQFSDPMTFRLPALRIRDLDDLAQYAEWSVVFSIIESLAVISMRSVKLRAEYEYGRKGELFKEQDICEMIDSYLVSRRVQNLISRSLKLRTFSKAGPYPVFRTSIQRDLADMVTIRLGDVKNGHSVRRLARATACTDPSGLKELLDARYVTPMSERQIARALSFTHPTRIPVISSQEHIYDHAIDDDYDEWPPIA
ncbi:hypothetical protein [Ferrimicrobium acidiphilum]|uniref:hypothetical protein n=1 Tax=Ferrimicrobium acidiphilum TaxID=121039 RepID=UPI0023EF6737|nr:hypothetical protein [Ferrimicrobium acidiphilum]